jgi:cytoskeleton protein RodZ
LRLVRHETAMRADEATLSPSALHGGPTGPHGDRGHSPSPVGALLRTTRQSQGLSLQDVAHTLRIRAPYLAAIEDGRLSDLPAPAYAVGFVKAYAKALGLDEAEALRRFRAEASGLARPTTLAFPAPVPERGVPAGAVAVLGLMLAGAAYGSWWFMSGAGVRPPETVTAPADRPAAPVVSRPPPPAIVAAPPDQRAPAGPLAGLPMIAATQPEAPVIIPPVPSPPPVAALPPPAASPASAQAAVPLAAVPLAAPPASSSAATLPGAALPDGMFGALPAEESRVLIRARAETWIQVRDRANGTVVFNRTLQPGQSYRAPMKPGLLLTMGNAPGTDVLVDGQVVANPFPTASVRRDIPLEPDRVREGLAQAPTLVRAPATPSAPTTSAPATQSGPGGWNWGAGGPSN